MKIIIVGEFSGFAKNLNLGFQKIGHQCFTFSWGDTFKKICPDRNTYLIDISNYQIFGKSIKGTNRIRRIFSNIKLHNFIRRTYSVEKADVILIVNPAFLLRERSLFSPFFSKDMLFHIVKDKENIYLSACGNDFIFNCYLPMSKKVNEYTLSKYYVGAEKGRKDFEYHISYIKKVIPVMYTYAVAYRYFQYCNDYRILNSVPLPFDVSSVNPTNVIENKVKIMHGVSRPHEKGSYIILASLERLKRKYEKYVDIKVVWRVPLKEYLQIMQEANIIIDQCYAIGYGMNTIEALAMGKVVLSGNEKENQEEFGIIENPIITIGPNADQIFKELEKLILNPQIINEISEKSRKYAENIHECSDVAKQYIELFCKN